MLQKVIIPFFLLITFISCSEKKERPTNALDTGRAFIRASLNGDFEEAEPFILKDSLNVGLFNSFKLYYKKLPQEKKQHYKDASYNINKYIDLNDSVTIINYSNDYMNKPMDIKVLKTNNQWWIDFKYTYSGNLPID